jgi:hypothetical protein
LGGGIAVETTEYSVTRKYGDFQVKYTVAISVVIVPAGQNIEFDEGKALEGARQGVKKEGGTVVAERTISAGGRNGWEFEVTSDTTDSTLRMFRKDFTIYVIEIACAKGKKFDKEKQQFFGSFIIQ